MSEEYAILFYRKSGCEYRPEQVIDAWRIMLANIEKGYNDVEPELEHDLSLRDEIDSILKDEDLLKFEDHKLFIDEILKIDNKIRLHIFPNPRYLDRYKDKEWWWFVILKKGGSVYAEEVKKSYNIDIEVVQ